MKFHIRAEFLETKLLVITLPKASRANTSQKYIYGKFANSNPPAIVNTLCRKNNALKIDLFYNNCVKSRADWLISMVNMSTYHRNDVIGNTTR